MTDAHGPLQGVKVVACSTAQAGTVPYMLMADLGAEVIKIEVPEGGDNSRGSTVFPGFPSTYFETNNRGVKSVTLNLKSAEGQAILRKLVAKADMFGQNFRPGAAEKNGFGYEDLRKVNPKLVYVSISGYGPGGPHADLPGTDSMAQALGGIAEAYSTPGQPLRTGIVSVADETCAILAFGGALAALNSPDGMDAHHGDVAEPEPRHRPGAHYRHGEPPRNERELQRSGRQAAGVSVERRAAVA
jgi:crotonobetainyl-CoA:carnitine CoA-transferase CaiB-like acyl-CoA transferase